MPFDPATMIQSVDNSGHGLRVVFYKLGDRWGHVIVALDGERVTPLLVSVEGSNEQVWPPSPPLQSLSIERREAGDVALLVGMAGRSHWSASVEATKNELDFDVACKLIDFPEWLGSRYRLLNTPRFLEGPTLLWSLADLEVQLNSYCAYASADHIEITPSNPGALQRWRYAIEFRVARLDSAA